MAEREVRLTLIYNAANGIGQGKNPPISTEKIFNAMEAAEKAEKERIAKKFDEAGWSPYAKLIREM